jgi:hypothetical protein
MVKGKCIKKGNFCRCRKANPKKFAKGSFRTIKGTKGIRIIVACEKGKWNKKSKRCRKGMKLQAILKPYKNKRC